MEACPLDVLDVFVLLAMSLAEATPLTVPPASLKHNSVSRPYVLSILLRSRGGKSSSGSPSPNDIPQ